MNVLGLFLISPSSHSCHHYYHPKCLLKPQETVFFFPSIHSHGTIIRVACSSHTNLSVDLTPHIPQIGRLNYLVNGKGTLSPIRLLGDVDILGRWKASQKDQPQPQPSSEPRFSTHQLTKFTVDEFFAYFEVSGSVRTICEQSVREFSQQPTDYDVLVKKVAEMTHRRYHAKENASRRLLYYGVMVVDGQLDSSVDEFVDVSVINRRQSTRLLEQSKQRQQEKRRRMEQRKAKQRNQGGGIVSVEGAASAATTTAGTVKNRQDKSSNSHPTNGIVHQVLEQNREEEENVSSSSSSSSNSTISCKQFWSRIDQLYYRSLPSVADCLPKPPEIQTTGKTPTSRGFTRSLMEFSVEREGEENDKQELLVLVDGGSERVQQGAIPRRDVRYDDDDD